MGDDAIHVAHCSRYRCVYGDPNCPAVEETLPGGKAEAALAVLREDVLGMSTAERDAWDALPESVAGDAAPEGTPLAERIRAVVMERDHERSGHRRCHERHMALEASLTEEYAVRNVSDDWVYALPRLIPKFLYGKRGTQEAAEWHRRQIAGPDPEDWTGFEIVKRPVGAWEVVA